MMEPNYIYRMISKEVVNFSNIIKSKRIKIIVVVLFEIIWLCACFTNLENLTLMQLLVRICSFTVMSGITFFFILYTRKKRISVPLELQFFDDRLVLIYNMHFYSHSLNEKKKVQYSIIYGEETRCTYDSRKKEIRFWGGEIYEKSYIYERDNSVPKETSYDGPFVKKSNAKNSEIYIGIDESSYHRLHSVLETNSLLKIQEI